MNNLLEWLQNTFFDDLCNGDWEHGGGITIETLDNPGWALNIDLHDTDMETMNFEKVKVEIDENNWYMCRVRDGIFEGRCGPKNLNDLLEIFRNWYIETDQRKSVS